MSKLTSYPSYRNSGLSWLRGIPAHWDVERIKFNSYVKGRIGWQNLRSDEFTNEGPYLITGMHFKEGGIDWDSCFHITDKRYQTAPEIQVKVGDLLITKDGSIGKLAYIDELPGKASLNSHLLVIRPLRKRYETRFLFYLLDSDLFKHYILETQTGTTFFGITQEVVENFFLILPPIPEQQAITDYLDRATDRIDSLIAKKQRLLELLAEKRAALISQAVTKGLNPDAEMKDSGVEWLGQVPEHWEVMPLKRAVANRVGAIKTGPFGSQLLSSEMIEGEMKVYNQRSVIDKDFVSGENYITREKYKELEAFTSYPGDVLVTTRGTIGKCAILPDDAELGILHPCLLRVQPHKRKLLAEYLSLVIQDSFLLQTQLFLLSNATTIDVIYSETMKKMIIPLPSLEEQREIIQFIKKESSQINTLVSKVETAIKRLHEYRSVQISAAVTGKIDVRGIKTNEQL
jgi:type I restriction enzyme S subunit